MVQFVNDIDLRGHEIKNVVAEHIAYDSLPDASVNEGRFIFDTTKKDLLFSNGIVWVSMSKTGITFKSNGVLTIDGVDVTVFTIASGGDVTMNSSKQAVIGVNKVTNAKMAKMPANTLKGNNTSASANADDLTVSEVLTMLGIDLDKLYSKVSDVKVNGATVVADGVALIDLETPINQALNSLKVGLPNGVATLDSSGKVPQSQLPSYVDDVLEYESKSLFPTTGEAGKIYVDKATNKTYRWGGSLYVEISSSLTIGEVTGTAADGGVAKNHYNDTTRHITATERTSWNAKQSTNVTVPPITEEGAIEPPTASITNTITNWITLLWRSVKSLTNRIVSLEGRKMFVTYDTGVLTGNTGTILASVHKCGTLPQIQAWLGGQLVICNIEINVDGDVTWSANETFTAGSDFRLMIQGGK